MSLAQDVERNPRLATIKTNNPALFHKICEQGGFLNEADLAKFAQIVPNQLLLVRCNAGRFLAPADQVAHFTRLIADYTRLLEERFGETNVKMIEQVASAKYTPPEWVRDVSIPA